MSDLEATDVWDVFDYFVRTRNSAALHLPTEASTIDEPEKRCTQGEDAATLVGSTTESIQKDTERVCAHCIADVNGTTAGGAEGADIWESRKRIGAIVEELGGTPP